MSDLKLVVFDVDGTLIDSQEFIKEGMRRAFRAMDWELPSDADILSIVGLSLFEAVHQLKPDVSEDEIHSGAEHYKQSFIDLRRERGGEASAPLYPGARDALEGLHARDELLMGVATGKAKRGLDHAYEAHQIGHFFVTHQTADDHPSKPHPSMLQRALYETGCNAHNGIMIGDTEFDMAMGRAAGFATIGVSWGYHALDRLHRGGADIVIDRFDDLTAAIQEIWEKRT